jgi:hypothetical protein
MHAPSTAPFSTCASTHTLTLTTRTDNNTTQRQIDLDQAREELRQAVAGGGTKGESCISFT